MQICRPLTYIFNLSIDQGIFPNSMKIAKVVPIFKQGSRLSSDNYRPISILSTLSKVFEKCIFHQVMFYLTSENNMLSPNQYGFRPVYTTSDCLIDLIEEITTRLDQGDYVVSLFLDLSKAFDTVNHEILLNKLRYYGILQKENNWFRSYLCNRKQQVHVNDVASKLHLISTGVPQGSILGPYYFSYLSMIFPSPLYIFQLDYMQMTHR